MRKRALLSLSLPLAAAGCLAGHTLGYALAGSDRRDAQAHGYLAFAPQFLALCIAVVVLALGMRFAGRLRGRPSAWPFAVLPPLAFCAQELVERLVAGLPAHSVLEPAVFVGLAAQLPVAVAAYLLVRALVRVVDSAARAVSPVDCVLRFPSACLLSPATSPGPARAQLAFDRLGRAPPRR